MCSSHQADHTSAYGSKFWPVNSRRTVAIASTTRGLATASALIRWGTARVTFRSWRICTARSWTPQSWSARREITRFSIVAAASEGGAAGVSPAPGAAGSGGLGAGSSGGDGGGGTGTPGAGSGGFGVSPPPGGVAPGSPAGGTAPGSPPGTAPGSPAGDASGGASGGGAISLRSASSAASRTRGSLSFWSDRARNSYEAFSSGFFAATRAAAARIVQGTFPFAPVNRFLRRSGGPPATAPVRSESTAAWARTFASSGASSAFHFARFSWSTG